MTGWERDFESWNAVQLFASDAVSREKAERKYSIHYTDY